MDLKDSAALHAVVCGTHLLRWGIRADATGFADLRNAKIDGSREHQTPNAAGERRLGQWLRFGGAVKMTVASQFQGISEWL